MQTPWEVSTTGARCIAAALGCCAAGFAAQAQTLDGNGALDAVAPTAQAARTEPALRLYASPASTPSALPGFAPQRPTVDLGLQLRHTFENNRQIDITAWRRMDEAPADAYALALRQQQPVYGARVELNLSPARKSGFAADRGFLGVQLESGARISLKRKDGRPMLYYRNQF